MRTLYKLSIALAVVVMGAMIGQIRAEESKTATIGQPAPQFTLKDITGKNVSLGDYSGKVVVLEWTNPQCPVVQRHYRAKTMTTLISKYAGKDVVWLGIATGDSAKPDMNKEFAEKNGVTHPILMDADRKVAQAYGAKATPHMFIISPEGKLSYMGAIDDDSQGNKGDKSVNYVDKALAEILAGQTVSQPETKAYGCSIK